MKVAVINFSGNVGKTTISGHMLKPRMNNAAIFSVESLNVDGAADGLDVEKIRGKRFGELVDQLMQSDSAIIDIGASNVEEFFKQMQQFAGSHEEFDFFLVPTVKEKKQQADTVNTLRALAKIGIPKSKIRVVFNKVETDDSVEDDFASLYGLEALEKGFLIKPNSIVYSNEVFERLKSVGKSLDDISNDTTDYRAKLRETTDASEKEYCIKMVSLKRLSVTANSNLDAAFKAIFK